ncbi:MAG: pilin biogenesis [Sulfuricurvum sp. PC08-66]|nr:MAG: pilin biogenesis [Sulfuricurvum sp. PC08-66]
MEPSSSTTSVNVSELTFETLNKIRGYLKRMILAKGSDLHVKANAQIRARINGEIIPLSGEIFSKEEALLFAKELLRSRFGEFAREKELDLVYPYDENTRFRVNIFWQMEGVSAVFRIIPVKILNIDELNLPAILHDLCALERGLVLVTGVTGSGKSTTLASMIDKINRTMRKHIITIEDPIEFVHKDRQSIVNQRNIGQDTISFSNALRAALREDPDIILVGEMRDLETIEIALHAADTGHLVFSTLHTMDTKETINRIISLFPSQEQNRIRTTLSSTLRAVLSQRLVVTKEGGRRAAIEVLLNTPRISQLILENKDYEIVETLEAGKSNYKTQTFDQALLDIYFEGVITKEEALRHATSPSDMKLKMAGLGEALNRVSQEIKANPSVNDEDVFDLKL